MGPLRVGQFVEEEDDLGERLEKYHGAFVRAEVVDQEGGGISGAVLEDLGHERLLLGLVEGGGEDPGREGR